MTRHAISRAVVLVLAAAMGGTALAGIAHATPAASAPAMAASGIAPAPEGATVTPAASGLMVPVTPVRVFDSRTTMFGGSGAPLAPHSDASFSAGSHIPSDAAAVLVNLTVTAPTAPGFIVLWHSSRPVPSTSNINFVAGETSANTALVALSDGDRNAMIGNISSGRTHVIVDIIGYLTKGPATKAGTSQAVAPARLLDTRVGKAVPAGGYVDVPVAGRAGIPGSDTVGAATLNVTVTTPVRNGYLVAFPTGTARPDPASTVNFVAGQTRAALTQAALGSGSVRIQNMSSGTVHVVVDAFAFTRSGPGATVLAGLTGTRPTRVLDTRTSTIMTANKQLTVDVSAVAPPTASAALVTVTATGSTTPGWLAATQIDGGVYTSTVNFTKGQSVANLALVPLTNSSFKLTNSARGSTHAVVDVVGWVSLANTVSGTVTAPDGTPIPNTRVHIGWVSDAAVTGTDGTFDVVTAPIQMSTNGGPVTRACFGAPVPADLDDPGFAGECYQDTLDPTPIPMPVGTAIRLGIVLARGSLVHGTVKDSSGNVVTGGSLTLVKSFRDTGYSVAIQSDGTYRVRNMWPGTFLATVRNARSAQVPTSGYADEVYDGVPYSTLPSAGQAMAAAATTTQVAAGAVVQGPDLVLDTAGAITGSVRYQNGTTTSAAMRATHVATGVVRGFNSLSDGAFTLSGVLPGTWKICAGPVASQRCWTSSTSVDGATPIDVAPGQTVTGIAITLP